MSGFTVIHSEEVKRTDDGREPVKKEQMYEESLTNPNGNAHIKVVATNTKRDPLFDPATLGEKGITLFYLNIMKQ